nr:replication initiation factor domain-containing protein [Lactococcus insecticola]
MNLTQKDIATAIGKTKQYVAKIESGRSNLSEQDEHKIKNVFESVRTSDVVSCVDWLRLRFKTLRYYDVIEKVLKIDMNKFHEEEKGGYNYPLRQQYGHMKIFYHKDDIDMGTMFEISGQGCREFESILLEQGRTWKDFFIDAMIYAQAHVTGSGEDIFDNFFKVTRIDIALDELYNEKYNYNLETLRMKLKNNLIQTKTRTFEIHEGFHKDRGEIVSKGMAVYIGARESPCYLCAYEKDKEQQLKTKGSLDEIHEKTRLKNRYELRLSDDKANQFIVAFVDRDSDVTQLAIDVMGSLFTVHDEDGDYNLEWLRLFGSFRKYKFLTQPKDVSEERTKIWLERQVIRTIRIQKEKDELKGDNWLERKIDEYELTDEDMQEIELSKQIKDQQDFIHVAVRTKNGRELLEATGYGATFDYAGN